MKGNTLVYLDVEEYERIRNTNKRSPETWCTEVIGYWVIKVPANVYELEFRGLLSLEEEMSVYIIWSLTEEDLNAKLVPNEAATNETKGVR